MAKKKESAVADTLPGLEEAPAIEKTFTKESLTQAIYDVFVADLVATTKNQNEDITEEEIIAVIILNKRKNANQANIIANSIFAK